MEKFRSEQMLTVESLIEWLKIQDPKACILGFETNSNAYIEQFRELPNRSICTVKDAKEDERTWIRSFYKDSDPKKEGFETLEELVEAKIAEVFRYAKDNDVIIRFC